MEWVTYVHSEEYKRQQLKLYPFKKDWEFIITDAVSDRVAGIDNCLMMQNKLRAMGIEDLIRPLGPFHIVESVKSG